MEPPRQPRDMQGLLRFAIEGTSSEDPTTATPSTMSEERRRWLEEALRGLSVDVVAELAKSIDNLSAERVESHEEDPQSMEEALDVIHDFADSIDTANDFHKIGGFRVLPPCLNSPHEGVRWRCCQLIATLAQNNPYCQDRLLKEDLMPRLLKMLDNDRCLEARIKSLYALSCMTRDCPEAQKVFVSLDGFSSLLKALQSSVDKLKIKASFMLTCLCNEDPSHKDVVANMGFVEQLVALLQRDHDTTHEHLLAALLALAADHRPSMDECRRSEFRLREMLESRVETLANRDECQEEVEYSRTLLSVLFREDPVEDR